MVELYRSTIVQQHKGECNWWNWLISHIIRINGENTFGIEVIKSYDESSNKIFFSGEGEYIEISWSWVNLSDFIVVGSSQEFADLVFTLFQISK